MNTVNVKVKSFYYLIETHRNPEVKKTEVLALAIYLLDIETILMIMEAAYKIYTKLS